MQALHYSLLHSDSLVKKQRMLRGNERCGNEWCDLALLVAWYNSFFDIIHGEYLKIEFRDSQKRMRLRMLRQRMELQWFRLLIFEFSLEILHRKKI